MAGQIKPILSLFEQAVQEGLRDGTRAVLKRARELSPTDTGESDRSGFTRVDDLTGQVGFTSLVSKLQHEDLDNLHPNGGGPKFLEKAAAEVDVTAYIARRVRAATNG